MSIAVLGCIEFEGVALDRALEGLGHTVWVMDGPEQAFEGLRRDRDAFELIIVDLRDAERDGLGMLAWLRTKHLVQRAEVWAIAAIDGEPTEEEQRQHGLGRVLAGDLSVEELAFGVRKLARVLAGDRRDDVRVEVRSKVLLGGFGRPVRGELVNLSRTGAFVRSDRVFAPGKRVSLAILFDEGEARLLLAGRVVRVQLEAERMWGVELEPGMGIEFTSLDDSARERLDSQLSRVDAV